MNSATVTITNCPTYSEAEERAHHHFSILFGGRHAYRIDTVELTTSPLLGDDSVPAQPVSDFKFTASRNLL